MDGRPQFGGPGLGGGGDFRGGFFRSIASAANYLGISESKLQSELAGGKTLAQAAKDHGESVDGLVNAMVADERTQFDAAVSAGRMTKEQEKTILSAVERLIKAIVNGDRPNRGFGQGDGGATPLPSPPG